MQFLVILFSFLMLTCSGGTIVGNGVITYRSEQYGFGFEYSSGLVLNEHSAEALELVDRQNYRSLKDVTGSIDKLTFLVVPLHSDDITPVLEYAKRTVPDVTWSDADMGGAPGFKAEKHEDHNWTQYVLRLSSEALIVITLSEFDKPEVAKALRHALSTFTYDLSSPKILTVDFLSSIVRAGEHNQVRIRVEDDQSGIDLETFGIKSPYHDSASSQTCLELVRNDGHKSAAFCSKATMDSAGVIEFDFDAQPNLESGSYFLSRFDVSDNDGNVTSAHYDQLNHVYRVKRAYTGKDDVNCDKIRQRNTLELNSRCYEVLQAPSLQIENDSKADVSAPLVSDIYVEPSNVAAGGDATLYFTASDDLSGIELRSFFPGQAWFQKSAYPGRSRFLFSRSTPLALGNNRYKVNIEIPPHMSAGKYSLIDQSLMDHSGNVSIFNSSLATITVVSDGVEDILPPVISELKIEPIKVRAGEAARVLIKATDDLSKIVAYDYCSTESFYPEGAGSSGAYRLTPIGLCNSQLHGIGNGWYEIPISVKPNTRPGRYRLLQLRLRDQAGNERNLISWADDSSGFFTDLDAGRELSPLPNVFLDVTE